MVLFMKKYALLRYCLVFLAIVLPYFSAATINGPESLQLTVDRGNQQVNSLQLTGNRADEDYPDPPEMPKKLPKLVELLISRTQRRQPGDIRLRFFDA